MYQCNFKPGATPKIPPTDPPVRPHHPHYPRQQHQHLFSTRKPMAVSKPQPSIKTLVSTPEVPPNTNQQENLQELLSDFDNLVTSQNLDYH